MAPITCLWAIYFNYSHSYFDKLLIRYLFRLASMNELLSLVAFYFSSLFHSLWAYTKITRAFFIFFVVSDYESFVQAAIHKLLFIKIANLEAIKKETFVKCQR
jgi:hypothetical protein